MACIYNSSAIWGFGKAKLFLLGFFILSFFFLPGLLHSQTNETVLETLHFSDYQGYIYRASSTLEADYHHEIGTYGMHTLFDGNYYTGWSEGTDGSGKGTVLWVEVPENADTLLVKNGFCRTAELFKKNNRIESFEITLWSGLLPAGMVTEFGPLYVIGPVSKAATLTLKDSMDIQNIALPFNYTEAKEKQQNYVEQFDTYAAENDLPPSIERRVYLLRMEITKVYKGSTWDDTCLTELRCFNSGSFTPASIQSREGAIIYQAYNGRDRKLYSERGTSFEPYLISDNGRWCAAIETPINQPEGRVETSYALFHLPYPERHKNSAVINALESGLMPVGFTKDGGELFIQFDDNSAVRLE